MIFLRKKTKLFVFILFAFPLLTSCIKKQADTIRIGILDGPSAISFIQMIEKNMKVEGKTIEFITKSEPQQIEALMMQDELDFAILPTIMAANLYNKGVDFRVLAFPIWGTLYILTNDSTIKSFSDLNHQTISIFGQGSTPDILFQCFLENNEMQNVTINYLYSGNNELAQALLNKKVKVAIISEPMVSILLESDNSIKIVSKLMCEKYSMSNKIDIFVQTSFLVNATFANNYKESIKVICDAYSESCNFINEQPEEAAKLLVKHGYFSDMESALLSLPLCNINYVSSFAAEPELIRYLSVFHDFNPDCIGGKLPDRNFIYQ